MQVLCPLFLLLLLRTTVNAQWKISAKVGSRTHPRHHPSQAQTSGENYEALPWSYDPRLPNGPHAWHERYPECGWRAQSPINIDERLAGKQTVFLWTLVFIMGGSLSLRVETHIFYRKFS